MMYLWKRPKLSDEAFVEKARRMYKRRKMTGSICIVVGLFGVALSAAMSWWVLDQLRPSTDIAEMFHGYTNIMSFMLGLGIGTHICILYALSMWNIALGLRRLFGADIRGIHLLLQCWDRLHGQDATPPPDVGRAPH